MGGFSTPSGGGGGGGTPSNTVVNEQTYGQGSTPGIVATYSRGDHTHGTPTAILPSGSVISETNYGQATNIGISAAYSRGDHSHGTPTVPALTQLSDVAIAGPVVDEILKYNGLNWVNGAQAVTGAGAGIMFFLDSTKIIPAGVGPQTKSLETLLRSPSSAAEVDESQTANNNTVLIDQYMYNTALGVTQIDGGEWEFDTYTYVDDASNTSEVIESVGRVFVGAGTITITGVGTTRTATVTGGTPFVPGDFNADITQTASILTPNAVLVVSGYTSTSVVTVTCLATYTNEVGVAYSVDRYLFQATTGDVNALAVSLYSTLTVQPAFPTNLTDKLLIKFFAKTNNVGNIVVHLVHNGTTNYTHLHTPLVTKHNDLAGLQGGVANEYYHLTQAEYTGTGTGNFVRLNGPTLTGSPVLSTATATSINKVAITAPATSATLTIADGKTLNVTNDATVSGTNTGDQTLPLASGTVSDETVYGIVANAGVAATFSRGDHTHGSPAAPTFALVSDANRNTKGGTDALRDNVAGTDNSAFGYNTLLLSTGAGFNTGFGSYALDAVTTGVNNTALGYNAGGAIATTNDTTCIGYQAGLVNTAANNTFIGSSAGDVNSSGTRNTAVGKDALGANTTSSDCTMVGYQAGLANTAASNTFVGSGCGDAITTGTRNVAMGHNALGANTLGNDNTAIGYNAYQQVAGGLNRSGVTAVGSGACNANTGNYCTAVGYNALDFNQNDSAGNTAIGAFALTGFAGPNPGGCTAVGYQAGAANGGGIDVTFIGYNAGALSTASNNTFVGAYCGDANTSGTRNTAVGKDALGAITTSADSTALGYQAGVTTTGANNVFIGSGADGSAAARTNAIGIGKGVSVVADSTWVIGTVGIKQAIVEGANAAMGTATLGAGGTVTVNNTLVTANSRIFISSQDPNGGTQGGVFVSARVAGTSFDITSTNAADTSIVAWEIKEPN